MKRFLTWCLAATLAVLCVTPALAARGFDETLPRVTDEVDWLTEDERDDLKMYVRDVAAAYGVDCPIFLLDGLNGDYENLTEYNDHLYRDLGYGCGDERICVILTVDMDAGQFIIDTYRGAGTAVSDEDRDALSDSFLENINGDMDVFDALVQHVDDAVRAVGLPDTSRNAALPRVTDEVGWLTDEEIEALETLIADAAQTYGADCPIFLLDGLDGQYEDLTDYHDHLYRDLDYGCGADRTCVFLSIDTEASVLNVNSYRGAGTAMSDEMLEGLTDRVVRDINSGMDLFDVLAEYVHDAAGCVSGAPYREAGAAKPDWYPEDPGAFTDFHNDPAAPRVVDNADIFTDAQEAEMAEKIAALQQQHGMDFVVLTDVTDYDLGHMAYADDYYQFNGYGFGDDYSGGLLLICMDPMNRGWWTTARGRYYELYTEENNDRLNERLRPYLVRGADGDAAAYGEGVLQYLEDTEQLMRTGKAPKTYHFGLPALAAIVSFVLGGGVALGVQRSRMKTVQHASEAHEYLVDRSFHLRRSHDFYLHSTVTRTRRQTQSRGGGGSSYSGGHTSSGGGSFRGGGGRF